MANTLVEHFPWLSLHHPLTARESRRIQHDLPTFFRKLTDPWTTLGYAAIIHGAFFVLALFSYGRLFPGLPTVLMPFLTPFGTPIAAGMLHSILYWAMLIGICNYTTHIIGHDVATGAWSILRATPYSSTTILGAKLVAVTRVWGRILRALLITRAVALLLIPIAIYLQKQSTDSPNAFSFSALSGIVFIVQPLVDAFLIVNLSAICGLLIPGVMWAKLGAYGLIALVYGGLSMIGGFWLMFRSPLGTLAGILVPLNHWTPLVTALIHSTSQAESSERLFVVAIFYLVLPLAAGLFACRVARRLAARIG